MSTSACPRFDLYLILPGDEAKKTPSEDGSDRQPVTNRNNNNNVNIKPNRKESGSGRRDSGSGGYKTLGQILGSMNIKALTTPDSFAQNAGEFAHERALRICGITRDDPEKYDKNRTSFLNIIADLGEGRARVVMDEVEGEIKQGELKSIENMAAYLMKRFTTEIANIRNGN